MAIAFAFKASMRRPAKERAPARARHGFGAFAVLVPRQYKLIERKTPEYALARGYKYSHHIVIRCGKEMTTPNCFQMTLHTYGALPGSCTRGSSTTILFRPPLSPECHRRPCLSQPAVGDVTRDAPSGQRPSICSVDSPVILEGERALSSSHGISILSGQKLSTRTDYIAFHAPPNPQCFHFPVR